MGRVRVAGFGVSLDGFGAGLDQSLEHPLGRRGPELFQWFFPTRTFCAMHGKDGGTTGVDDDFARRVDWLLDELPPPDGGLRYAFELRNRDLLTPRYLDALRAHGAAHALSLWSGMPGVGEQLAVPGVLTAPFCVCRLSLPPGTRYADRAAAFNPFDRTHDPQPGVRADVVRLAQKCSEWPRELYVIVNNKVEGSSPLTVKALARDLVAALAPPS